MDPKVQKIIDEVSARVARQTQLMHEGKSFSLDELAMAAGPDTAGFLNMLIRTMDAKRIIEVGTGIGYTALWLGEAARATGGQVIGIEGLESKQREAVEYISRAGLSDVVEVRLGDAKNFVQELSGPIDLVFIDAWKNDYFYYFDTLLPKLRVGGCIVSDNITFPSRNIETMQRYQQHIRSQPNVISRLLPFANGEEMSVKIAE